MANEKRLIDASTLADKVDESKYNNPHPQGIMRVNHRNEHDHFLRMILDAPTVDAVEVVHGYVLPAEEPKKVLLDMKCAICDQLMLSTDAYCPMCGAKMDGERREGE